MPDFSSWSAHMDFWREWGFEPWTLCGMEGLYRRVTFRKEALLGEVARYYALDYLIWKHQGAGDMDWVFATWKPAPHVVLHRFIFLGGERGVQMRKRSFWFGLRGFLEVHSYTPGVPPPRSIKDIGWLIDNVGKVVQDGHGLENQAFRPPG